MEPVTIIVLGAGAVAISFIGGLISGKSLESSVSRDVQNKLRLEIKALTVEIDARTDLGMAQKDDIKMLKESVIRKNAEISKLKKRKCPDIIKDKVEDVVDDVKEFVDDKIEDAKDLIDRVKGKKKRKYTKKKK